MQGSRLDRQDAQGIKRTTLAWQKLATGLVLALMGSLLPGLGWGQDYSASGNPVTLVTIGPARVQAEVVRSPEKIYLGLGYRQSLPEGQGMLFVMPAEDVQIFCMRGMRFPLDIIWIADGKVVGLEKNVSPRYPGNLPSPLPVRYVLEVPGGSGDRHGIKVGDPVSW